MSSIRRAVWGSLGFQRLWRLCAHGIFVFTVAGMTSYPAASQPSSFLMTLRSAPPPEAANNLCHKLPWACAKGPQGQIISSSHIPYITKVNRQINRQVRSIEDHAQHRVADYWSLPTARGGDCEDFALLKKRELIQRGYPAHALMIATALDTNRRGHAVLVVRTNIGDYVLDNLTNNVRLWSQTGYIFLRMQNPNAPHSWIMPASS